MSPFVIGVFEPVRNEVSDTIMNVIEGSIPNEMNGMFVKNGPNPYFLPKLGQPYHWFDGDGMITGINIENGKAIFKNRWVRTKRLEKDIENGDTVFSFGEMQRGNLDSLYTDRVFDMETNRMMGRMQTNLLYHGRRLFALEETDLPYHITLPKLSTIGQFTYSGKLKHAMTAHPKVDPRTGELFIFGHEVHPTKNFVSLTKIAASGEVISSIKVKVPGARFMHDMAITKNYMIIFDLPAVFNFSVEPGGSPWIFEDDLPTRFGIIGRNELDGSKIRWFSVKTCMIFHTTNAYEENDKIVLQTCRAEGYTMNFNASHNPKNWLYPYEWVLDLSTGSVSETKLCTIRCDFPMISPVMVGIKQRFSYYTTYRSREPDHVPLYDGIVKYDHVKKEVLAHLKCEEHIAVAEHTFVARNHNSKPSDSNFIEDDGWLITFSFNSLTNKSELWIYDAKTLTSKSKPIARISCPQRVPLGFHGTWVSRKEVEQAINC